MSNEGAFLQALRGAEFSFARRPEPIAGDLRMSWGIGVVLLALLYSHGKKASFLKLHLLAHSIRTSEGRNQVLGVLAGNVRPADVQVRVEPWLNRSVAFAHGLNLVAVNRGKSAALTDFGLKVASAIDADSAVFSVERDFLGKVTRRLTEQTLTRIWRMEALF